MGTTARNIEIGKLRKSAKDPENLPITRILSARRLCRDYGFTDEHQRIAKRTAKMFVQNIDLEEKVRRAALNLLQFVIDHKETKEDEEDRESLEGTEEDLFDSTQTVPERPALPQLPRVEELAKRNAKWNGVEGADDTCIEPPQKFLHYYEAADLIPFGISDLDSPDSHYFAPMGEGEPMQSGLIKRIVNPKYLEAFRAWKDRKFHGVLPDRMSVWYGMFERKPDNFEVNPELYIGDKLTKYMLDTKQIAKWELDCEFLRDLWFEIFLCGPGSKRHTDEEFCKNFVWTE